MSRTESSSDLVRDLMDYGLDVRARRVFLQADIGAEAGDEYNQAMLVIRGLMFLDRTPGPIELWLNSPGGSVDDALAIHDIMTTAMDNPVVTVGHGLVASAATLLLAAGTGTRYVTNHCYFMHHEGTISRSEGSLKLHEVQLEQHKREARIWNKLMGRYTRHTSQWWAKKTIEVPELWLDARQMIAHGVADRILE